MKATVRVVNMPALMELSHGSQPFHTTKSTQKSKKHAYKESIKVALDNITVSH